MKPQSSKPFPDDDGAAAHSGVGRDRVTEEEDTIELGWYVRALQRRWLLLAGVTLLAGAAAFGIATLQPLRYEGVTTLLVVPQSTVTKSVAPLSAKFFMASIFGPYPSKIRSGI